MENERFLSELNVEFQKKETNYTLVLDHRRNAASVCDGYRAQDMTLRSSGVATEFGLNIDWS
jgi:hypothetical protein